MKKLHDIGSDMEPGLLPDSSCLQCEVIDIKLLEEYIPPPSVPISHSLFCMLPGTRTEFRIDCKG